MGIRFLETMRGVLSDEQGTPHPMTLHLRCEARHGLRFLVSGRTRIVGTIHATPWADHLPCRGELLISPLIKRQIVYDLSFSDGETEYRLHGEKDLSALHPIRSMITLETTLQQDNRPCARGVLYFDLRDLNDFIRSWSFSTSFQDNVPFPIEKQALPEVSLLTPKEQQLLVALAEALIVPGRCVPSVTYRTTDIAQGILPSLPPLFLTLYRTTLHMIDRASMLHFRRSFSAITIEHRRKLLKRITSHGTVPRALVQTLGLPLKIAHFSRRDYLDRIGVVYPDPPGQSSPPRWMSRVFAPEQLETETQFECDVIVVGSGAGGGAIAAALSERGYSVAIVEEGRYEQRPQFAGGPEERMMRFWRDGGMTLAFGNTPLIIPVGKLVGGSTAINSGTCYRTPDEILNEWRALGLPSDFSPERFAPYLDRVEQELQVTEADRRWLGRIAEVVAKGADVLGGTHGPLRRNAPHCDGQGVCVFGCPTDAKRSSNVSWIPRALKAGATLFTGIPVTQLLSDGISYHGVEATGQDRFGAPKRIHLRGRTIALACGALHTPLLLARQGFRSSWLGSNLSIHPALGAFALFHDDLGAPWRAIPQGYFVEGLVDPRIRFEGFYLPPQLAGAFLPLDDQELTRWMDNWNRVAQFGFMVRDRGSGSVTLSPRGTPLIRYTVTREVHDLFRRGSATLAEMLLRGGALEVSTGIEGLPSVETIAEARAIAHASIRPLQFHPVGFHPLGTCRIGASPKHGVCDPEHRVFGTQNLFVADGSSVPTSLGVNPQVTIMAMSLRCADIVAATL